MPFAGYENFDACVAANSDKADAKAYCGQIQADAEKAARQDALKRFTIAKIDEDRQLVFGWASVSVAKDGKTVLDLQGDLIAPEELEKTAYGYLLLRGDANEMHTEDQIGQPVESFVVTPDKLQKMGLAPNALPQGWWVGYYIESPEVFARVKSGELKAFSIEGTGERRAAFA